MSAYPIPHDALLADRLGFVGTSGSGKTYNAGSAIERALHAGARAVIVDPLGVWWGLRLNADGDAASRFKVVIFGGPHGDLPLSEHAGALIGETVAEDLIACRGCGCTEDAACATPAGPCHWVEADLCSACVSQRRKR